MNAIKIIMNIISATKLTLMTLCLSVGLVIGTMHGTIDLKWAIIAGGTVFLCFVTSLYAWSTINK